MTNCLKKIDILFIYFNDYIDYETVISSVSKLKKNYPESFAERITAMLVIFL